MNRAIFTSENDRWGTPDWLYAWLNAQLKFTLDVCAERWNRKAPRFFSPKQNGLLQSWRGERCWHNPPYSQVEAWMRRARRAALLENALVASLVPARVDTEWWDRYVLHGDGTAGEVLDARFDPLSRTWWVDREGASTALHFVKGRVDFDTPPDAVKRGESTAPFPSAVIIYVPAGMPAPHPWPVGINGLGPWLTRLWPSPSLCTRLHAGAGRPALLKNNEAPGPLASASFSQQGGAPSLSDPTGLEYSATAFTQLKSNHAVRENDDGER